jgi:hypothetical protein
VTRCWHTCVWSRRRTDKPEAVGYNSRDRRNCRRKIRHPHYLTALLHARRLRQDNNLIIYPCCFCQHLHVGHSRKMKRKRPVVYDSPWERKRVRLERKIAPVQRQLMQLQLNLTRLLACPPQPGPQAEGPHPGHLAGCL